MANNIVIKKQYGPNVSLPLLQQRVQEAIQSVPSASSTATSTSEGTTGYAQISAPQYVVGSNDYWIACDSTNNPITITLIPAKNAGDQDLIIKDRTGQAGVNPITINVGRGIDTIDGMASYQIKTAYGVVRLKCDGISRWMGW